MNITSDLLRKCAESRKEVKKLSNLREEHGKKCDDKKYKIEWHYRDQIRELERKSSNEQNVIEKEKEDYKNKIDVQRTPHYEIIKFTEKVFKHIDIILSNDEPEPIKEIRFRYMNEDPIILEVIADDNYKKVYAYITKNSKPKNKYSLFIKRHSIFSRYDKFKEVSGDNGLLKELPTLKELQTWYENMKNKGSDFKWKWGSHAFSLKEYLEAHARLEQEHEEVKSLWKQRQWQRAYWLYQKYYYKHYYSNGTSTDMYHDVVLLLETPYEDTALLINRMKSDIGKAEFKRRLKEESLI
jgi:hypothetical protein